MFLISFVAGSFGEFYVPSRLIVAGNAAATVSNILDHEMLFRLGFAGYLLEALCDVGLEQVAGKADRKSTRLNSSHVSTSYAVFCSKKKICPSIARSSPNYTRRVRGF